MKRCFVCFVLKVDIPKWVYCGLTVPGEEVRNNLFKEKKWASNGRKQHKSLSCETIDLG
jgi:hypothetical protein